MRAIAGAFCSSDLDRPFGTHNEELLKAIGAQLKTELHARHRMGEAAMLRS